MKGGRQKTNAFSVGSQMSANKLEPGYYKDRRDGSYALVQLRGHLAVSDSDYRIIYYHPNNPKDDQFFYHELREEELDDKFISYFIPIEDPALLAKFLLGTFNFPFIAGSASKDK